MPDTGLLSFHFLRPWWLLAIAPTALLLLLILRRDRAEAKWGGIIAPHLLRHLVVKPGGEWGLRPVVLVGVALLLGIVAVAGPTWRRELPPFVEDTASLMIALDVSESMSRSDVPPFRLERARQKIRDLLEARAGARTGLIAYAGSAHLVMPLTDDRAVVEPFLAALAPGIMPVEGKRPAAAIALAADALAKEPVAGTILVVADELSGADATALRQSAGRNGLLMLGVAPSGEADPAARELGSQLVRSTVDDADVRTLERRIETSFRAAQAAQSGARWRDEGYWLLLPILALGFVWFRRGSTVHWALLLLLWQGGSAQAADQARLLDWWVTPDQQGRLAFEHGDYADAAKLFEDPLWRGIAAYRAYDYLAAAEAFQHVETPRGRLALGNAQARNHAYEKAIKAYEDVLAQQPDNAAAKHNLAVVRAALEAQEERRRKEEKDQSTGDLPPDETKVDPKQKGGKRTLVRPEDVTTPGAAEAWMKQVQTSPADFLKLKFAIQAAGAPKSGGSAR